MTDVQLLDTLLKWGTVIGMGGGALAWGFDYNKKRRDTRIAQAKEHSVGAERITKLEQRLEIICDDFEKFRVEFFNYLFQRLK